MSFFKRNKTDHAHAQKENAHAHAHPHQLQHQGSLQNLSGVAAGVGSPTRDGEKRGMVGSPPAG